MPVANFEIARLEWIATVPLPCTDCPTIRLLPTQDGVYSVTAYDANGCSVTTSTTIRLQKQNQLYLPNIFSPNGDGINDIYQIFAGNSIASIQQFRIFDAEGRLMYQVNDRLPTDNSVGWDGRFNGQKMLPSVFVVLVEVVLIDGTTAEYRGDFTLVE